MQSDAELRRGIAAGLSAYLLWGLLALYWKALGDFDPFELIGWRILCSVVLLVVVVGLSGRLGAIVPAVMAPGVRWRVPVAGVLLGINWTAYVYAVSEDHVIETALGYFMSPIGTMLIGVVVLKERLRGAQRAALVLAVAAVCVLTFSYGQVPVIALVLAVTWSIYALIKKRVALRPLEGLAAETFVVLPAALALLVWSAGREGSVPTSASSAEWALVLASGAITTVPLVLFAAAAHRLPLTVLGPMQYTVPTINFLLGWLVFGEDLPPARMIGFGLVWVALVVLSVDSAGRSRRTFATRSA